MTEPDPVAVAVEAALTPSVAEAAAEVDAWTRTMAARTVNGWDFVSIGPGPDLPRLRLRSLRVLTEHAYATGPACDGTICEQGGAAHCHRCAEVEADKLLAERDQLRDRLAAVRELGERWAALAPADDWGDSMGDTAAADVGRVLLAALDATPAAEPDPLNLPAYAWGESVTWNQGRILVPLNRDNETVADLVLDEDDAGTLAAMLDDAAGHKPPDCPRCFDRGYVPDWSRGLSAEHGEPGKKPCPDCQGTQENQA